MDNCLLITIDKFQNLLIESVRLLVKRLAIALAGLPLRVL